MNFLSWPCAAFLHDERDRKCSERNIITNMPLSKVVGNANGRSSLNTSGRRRSQRAQLINNYCRPSSISILRWFSLRVAFWEGCIRRKPRWWEGLWNADGKAKDWKFKNHLQVWGWQSSSRPGQFFLVLFFMCTSAPCDNKVSMTRFATLVGPRYQP